MTRAMAVLMKVQAGRLAATFSNVSAAHEKVAQVAKLLKDWHWSFSTLVKQWLTFKDSQQGMRSARKRSDLGPID